MSKTPRCIATALLALFAVPSFALALEIEGDIALPSNCTVQDKNGLSHSFPKQDSPSSYLAVCALSKALETGLIGSMQLNEFPGFGLFVEGLQGVVAGGDEFWALWLNGNFAECGIECLPLSKGDTFSLILSSFDGANRGSRVILHITSLQGGSVSSSPAPSRGGTPPPPPKFDVGNALGFLIDTQMNDGSFGTERITDWAAIALGSAKDASVCVSKCAEAREKTRNLLLTQKPELSNITDYERHSMALMALGINPYMGTSLDFVTPIVAAFDGEQVGDPKLVNDDIFALFPLSRGGFSYSDNVIGKTVSFIIGKQKPDGSWEESVDLTAAAIQALSPFTSVTEVNKAVADAREYLRSTQDTTGGWKNSFSTSWALQSLATLKESPSSWTKSGNSPLNFLGLLQLSDGGLEPTSSDSATRIWASSYAIPAALGKSWYDVLQSFPKAEKTIAVKETENSIITGAATSTTVPEVSTTTASTQTSLPEASATVNPLPVESSIMPPVPKAPLQKSAVTKIETTESPSATTTAETTTVENQVASAAASSPESGTLVWIVGLVAILGGAFFFVRRA